MNTASNYEPIPTTCEGLFAWCARRGKLGSVYQLEDRFRVSIAGFYLDANRRDYWDGPSVAKIIEKLNTRLAEVAKERAA